MNTKLKDCYLLKQLNNAKVQALKDKYEIQLDYFIPGYGKRFNILEGEPDTAILNSNSGSSYNSNSGSNSGNNSNIQK